jgi:hypothetical protein
MAAAREQAHDRQHFEAPLQRTTAGREDDSHLVSVLEHHDEAPLQRTTAGREDDSHLVSVLEHHDEAPLQRTTAGRADNSHLVSVLEHHDEALRNAPLQEEETILTWYLFWSTMTKPCATHHCRKISENRSTLGLSTGSVSMVSTNPME